MESLCCVSPGLPCDVMLGELEHVGSGEGTRRETRVQEGGGRSSLSSFTDKAPIDPHPTTRVAPSSEVTCLSPKLQDKGGGVLLRMGCLG